MTRERAADWVMRIGLAFAFIYPPLNAIADPNSWIGYFPSFLHGIVPDPLLLHSFGVVEIIIALWILWGRYIFWPAALACIMLVAIVVFNIAQMQVVFRDLSIAATALYLALRNLPIRRAVSV
jgi:uncharacterized membrane protein YphA (DoxX/SURF4 family)